MRGIRRRPSFAAIVAITLALGVGANAAVFSVLNAVLLHGAPYREPDRLVAIDENNVPGGARYSDVAAAEYLDWTTATRSFEGIATAGQRSFTYAEGSGARPNSRSSRIRQLLRRVGCRSRARTNVPGPEKTAASIA
jgi:hypothetical protein